MKVLEPSLTDEELVRLENDTFKYFADEVNLDKWCLQRAAKKHKKHKRFFAKAFVPFVALILFRFEGNQHD